MVLIETVKKYKSSLADLLNIVRTLRIRLVSNLHISLGSLSYSKNNFKYYLFNISSLSSSVSRGCRAAPQTWPR
jgi:hypothetical protein